MYDYYYTPVGYTSRKKFASIIKYLIIMNGTVFLKKRCIIFVVVMVHHTNSKTADS